MNTVKELRDNYFRYKEKGTETHQNILQKTEEIRDLKLKIHQLKSVVEDMGRNVNTAIRGLGYLSADDFVSLKKEFSEKKSTLAELIELLPFHERELKGLNNDRQSYGQKKRDVSNQMAEIFANQAVDAIADTETDNLKVLVNNIQSQQDFRLPKDGYKNDLYYQIGEKLCAKIYDAGENHALSIPTTRQSIVERDEMIENLA